MKIKLINFLKQQGIKYPEDIIVNFDKSLGPDVCQLENIGYNQANAEWSNIEVEVPEPVNQPDRNCDKEWFNETC